MAKFFGKINYFVFFIALLFCVICSYVYINKDTNIGDLSSDIWGYQFLEIQERYEYWRDVPASYNQSELYIGFPLVYYLSPDFNYGVWGYHLLALFIIVSTFIVSGLVGKNIFGHWMPAAILALLLIIPRFIFPTRIGLLDLSVVRGSILVMPFYVLLSYLWLMKGVLNPYWNVFLAILAGFSIYLYPPFGLITISTFILTAFLIYRRDKTILKSIFFFVLVFTVVVSPFFINHLTNSSTGMLDESKTLSAAQTSKQLEIVQYKFRGSGFLQSVDFADVKRSVWDESLLVLILFLSWALILKGFKKDQEQSEWFYKVTIITSLITVITISFSSVIEIINYLSIDRGNLPVFIDHLRPLKTIGVVLIVQAVGFCTFIYSKSLLGRFISIIIIFMLILMPIRFFAPVIRSFVRIFIPENVRLEYNLAPIVRQEDSRSFQDMSDVALWSRINLDKNQTSIFLFDDIQNDFRFKVLSHHDTNLTNKEGNLWVTSGFDNSVRWYEERMQYKKIVENATNFSDILDFAKSLKMTHMLIPRGKYEDLFISSGLNLKTIYQNYDYRLIAI